jgi:phosphohistidine phosphatase
MLMRHAKSSWGDELLPDFERPLNSRGERDATAIGRKLDGQDVNLEVVISSSSVRTMETTKRLIAALSHKPHPEVHYERGLYAASANRIIEEVSQISDSFQTALLIGHNPGMTEAVAELTGYWLPGGMKTATVVCISLDIEQWEDVRTEVGKLEWTLYADKENGPEKL